MSVLLLGIREEHLIPAEFEPLTVQVYMCLPNNTLKATITCISVKIFEIYKYARLHIYILYVMQDQSMLKQP